VLQDAAFWEALFAYAQGKQGGAPGAAAAHEQRILGLVKGIHASHRRVLPAWLKNLMPEDIVGWDAVTWQCGYAWGIICALLPVELVSQAIEDPLGVVAGVAQLLVEMVKNPVWRAIEQLFRLVERTVRSGATRRKAPAGGCERPIRCPRTAARAPPAGKLTGRG
jgi:hypothetical protein